MVRRGKAAVALGRTLPPLPILRAKPCECDRHSRTSARAASQAVLARLDFPAVYESQLAAWARFQGALTDLATATVGNVLVVTHGDAVGAIVEQVQPDATVYSVDTAGYVHLAQAAAGSRVTVESASGVLWMTS